jgi:hypothetical protein
LSLDDEEEDSEEIDPELAIAMEKKRERKREEKKERKRVKKAMKEAMKEAAAAAGEPTKKRKLTDRESENAGSSKRARGTKTAPPPPRLNGSENDVPEQERENGIARNTAATAEVEYASNGERVALQKAQTQGAPRLSMPETDAESTDSEIGGAGLSKSVVWDDEVPPIACLSP